MRDGASRPLRWFGMTGTRLAHVAHGGAYSVTQFAMARFGLGIGESGNFPAGIKSVALWFPQKERALATGLFNSGTSLRRP